MNVLECGHFRGKETYMYVYLSEEARKPRNPGCIAYHLNELMLGEMLHSGVYKAVKRNTQSRFFFI